MAEPTEQTPGHEHSAEGRGATSEGAATLPIEIDQGEVTFGKRCAWCGVAGTVLTWRLMADAASSPLEQPAWYPTIPVYEAKVRCKSCGCASYGLLVSGLFVVLPLDRTAVW